MVPYLGDFSEDATVYIYFNTFDNTDPTGSVTVTTLIASDIYVHKDGSLTQIATDGATIDIDFDARTGVHEIQIDTSAHADYSTGSDYVVIIEGATVDGGNITAAVATFSIENRHASTVANSIRATQVTNTGTGQAGSTASTIILASGHVIASDNLNGYNVIITGGTGIGQERTITDSTITTDVCAIAPDWIITPDNTSTYELKPANNGVVEVDANGRVDVSKVSGTAQTAGDLAALIATAQADLDLITGADGVNLLTATQASIDAVEAGVNLTSVGGEAISKGGSAPSSPYGQT